MILFVKLHALESLHYPPYPIYFAIFQLEF